MQLHLILGILFIVMLIQSFFSFLQIRRIYKTISAQKRKYHNNSYSLSVGFSKARLLKFSSGVVLIIVLDSESVIQDYHQMKGLFVFSKMKQIPSYIGKTPDQIMKLLNSQQALALTSALEQIAI